MTLGSLRRQNVKNSTNTIPTASFSKIPFLCGSTLKNKVFLQFDASALGCIRWINRNMQAAKL